MRGSLPMGPSARERRARGRSREGGAAAFTLLEILIGLGVLATAIVGLLGAVNHSLRMQRSAILATEASLLARQKMEALLNDKDLSQGSDGGTFEGHPGFRWTSNVDEADLALFFEERKTPLWRLSLSVQYDDGRPRTVELSTIFRNRTRER